MTSTLCKFIGVEQQLESLLGAQRLSKKFVFWFETETDKYQITTDTLYMQHSVLKEVLDGLSTIPKGNGIYDVGDYQSVLGLGFEDGGFIDGYNLTFNCVQQIVEPFLGSTYTVWLQPDINSASKDTFVVLSSFIWAGDYSVNRD